MTQRTFNILTKAEIKEIAEFSSTSTVMLTMLECNVAENVVMRCRKAHGVKGKNRVKGNSSKMQKAIADVLGGKTVGAASRLNGVNVDYLGKKLQALREKEMRGFPPSLLVMARATGFFDWKGEGRTGLAA
ncbi:MAG: hypothetical protein R8K20_05890 [Gallionellaceae bacterium]